MPPSSPFPSTITSMKLRVSTGAAPNAVTHEQNIPSAKLGSNTVPITPELVSALNDQIAGTIFTPSVVTTYGSDSLTTVSTNSVSNFVTRKITPTISLANIPNKFTIDAPFSLSGLITTDSVGALSYSSSNTSVATVSSAGLVTIVGAGTTTITINQAASTNGVYSAATPVSASFQVQQLPTKEWRQRGFDIDGEAGTDYSGYSVSLSSDGTTLAIGAIYNDAAGSDAGHVRVYKYDLYPTLGTFSLPTDIIYMNETITRQLTPPTSNSNGSFVYTSSNTAVATITNDAGVYSVNVIGAGTSVITATQAASGVYAS